MDIKELTAWVESLYQKDLDKANEYFDYYINEGNQQAKELERLYRGSSYMALKILYKLEFITSNKLGGE